MHDGGEVQYVYKENIRRTIASERNSEWLNYMILYDRDQNIV